MSLKEAITYQPYNCYACFAMLYIRPTDTGCADVSTCCTHIDKKHNRVFAFEDIAKAWNHINFQHQRRLVLSHDWSFCYGNRCMPFRMYPDFDHLHNEPDVLNAVKNNRLKLSYMPKALWVITSYECNNNCPFCYQKEQRPRRHRFVLNPNIISELKNYLIPQAKKVVLTGGEPFLNDPKLINFISVNYPSIDLGVGTNGILLHEYGIDRLIRDDIHLTISVYGFEETLYNSLTRSNNYKYFISNLRQLIRKGYSKNITLDYIVYNEPTLQNLTFFLKFVRSHPALSAIVRDNHWGGLRYQDAILDLCDKEFSDIGKRIKIYLRGQRGFSRFLNKCYNHIYNLRTIKHKKDENTSC